MRHGKSGHVIWICLIAWFPIALFSQVTCTGTFGDNIFTEGDFGRGPQNVLPDVSGLAPGYTYTTATPPGDGFFTITNDMGRWGNNYDTWLNVGDNSDDPQGYMMVVNASYSPGVFYEQTIDNLCPDATFEFSADILNVVRPGVTGHSLPDLDFLIDDSVRYSTGEIPQDGKWHKHGFTFSLEPGQSSLKLTLINKAPGGIGNDLALDNITFRPCGPEPDLDLPDIVSFCQEDGQTGRISTSVDTNQFALQWQSQLSGVEEWQNIGQVNLLVLPLDLSVPGTFFYRYKLSTSAANLDNPLCVSYSKMVRVIVEPRVYEVWDTICMGNVRGFNGRLLTSPGTYQSRLTSVRGCDSIVVLHLAMVDKRPLIFDLGFEDPSCFQYADGSIEIQNVQGGYPPYEYYINGESNGSPRIENLTSGLKAIQVHDRYGCVSSQSIRLTDPPEFKLMPIPDTQLVLGEPLTVSIQASDPISSLEAEPNILENCPSCTEVTFVPFHSTEVEVVATNSAGCTSTIRFYIEVDDENLPIVFPNAFSPNGDGVNDDFRFIAPPYLITRIREIRILDRWGNEVYSSLERTDGRDVVLWDGMTQSQQVEPGLYAYICEVELINGETRLYSGEVLITGL